VPANEPGLAPLLEQAATVTAAADRAAAVVRTLLRTCRPAAVDVQGPAAAVVADEDLREVDPVLRRGRDQGVVFQVDELGPLDLADQLGQLAEGGLRHPDPAVGVLRDLGPPHRVLVAAGVPGAVDPLRVRRGDRSGGEVDASQLLEQVAVDLEVDGERVAAVGEQRDRDVRARHDPQERGLANGPAVVAEHRAAGPVEQLPAEAPVGAHQAERRHRDLRLPHGLDAAGRQHPGTVRRGAVAQVHGGEREQVTGTHGQHRPSRPVGLHQGPHRGRDRLAVGALGVGQVPDGGAEQDRRVRVGRRVREAKGREQVLAQRPVEWLAPQHLDDPPEDAEPGVVVGEHLARREQLRVGPQRRDVLLDAVVVPAGVGEDVTLEPGLVA
jgi:hypothetical protein